MLGLLPFEQKKIPQPFPILFSWYVAQSNTFLGMKTLLLAHRIIKAHTLERITINVHSLKLIAKINVGVGLINKLLC